MRKPYANYYGAAQNILPNMLQLLLVCGQWYSWGVVIHQRLWLKSSEMGHSRSIFVYFNLFLSKFTEKFRLQLESNLDRPNRR